MLSYPLRHYKLGVVSMKQGQYSGVNTLNRTESVEYVNRVSVQNSV